MGGDAKPKEVKSVGVLGAGTMGSGIAMAFLNAKVCTSIYSFVCVCVCVCVFACACVCAFGCALCCLDACFFFFSRSE